MAMSCVVIFAEEASKQIHEYKLKLQKSEQEIANLEGTVSICPTHPQFINVYTVNLPYSGICYNSGMFKNKIAESLYKALNRYC